MRETSTTRMITIEREDEPRRLVILQNDPRRILIDALDELNVARAFLSKPSLSAMPPGRRRDVCLCPVAIGFSQGAVVTCGGEVAFPTAADAALVRQAWYPTRRADDSRYVRLPINLRLFVRSFDRGGYPELDADTVLAAAVG